MRTPIIFALLLAGSLSTSTASAFFWGTTSSDSTTPAPSTQASVNLATPEGIAEFIQPASFVSFMNPAAFAQFLQPSFYMQFANPSNWAKWTNPQSFFTFMNPNTFMQYTNPQAYQPFMNPNAFAQFTNPANYNVYMNPNSYAQWVDPKSYSIPGAAADSKDAFNMFDPTAWMKFFDPNQRVNNQADQVAQAEQDETIENETEKEEEVN